MQNPTLVIVEIHYISFCPALQRVQISLNRNTNLWSLSHSSQICPYHSSYHKLSYHISKLAHLPAHFPMPLKSVMNNTNSHSKLWETPAVTFLLLTFLAFFQPVTYPQKNLLLKLMITKLPWKLLMMVLSKVFKTPSRLGQLCCHCPNIS